MRKIQKKWLYVMVALLVIFSVYQTAIAYKLNKKLVETENELSEARDKLYTVRNKFEDLQLKVSDLQGLISDLYHNRSSYRIEDVESEADELSNDIDDAENEASE